MSDTPTAGTENKPRPEDVESPDAIIKAMYDTISGPAGPRNWYRERSFFAPGARLIPIGKRVHRDGGFEVMNIEEWIEDAQDYLAENDFYETEIMRQMNQFGNIVHAFSTYEARNSLDGELITRGINSIQLLHNEDRWWVVTIMWDNESRENPIPEEFLPYLW
jgi:hypothetical protein